MKTLLATIIILVALVSLSLGLTMVFTEDHSQFLPGLLALLGELLLAAANILVLLLNLLYWKLYGAPRWLRIVIGIQAVPAAVTLALALTQVYRNWQQDQAYDQRFSLYKTIRADRVSDLAAKQTQCNERCSGLYSLNEQLLDAADAKAYRIAQKLIGEHARVSSKLGQAGKTLHTCEGDALIALNALEAAVARDDPKMVHLLLPASDTSARRRAMWLAARLDHLDIVKSLAAAGVPLSIRGHILDANNTLLVAAASGAALTVGKWLIQTQHMPVNAISNGPDPYAGISPINALMAFKNSVRHSPRIKPFLQMLVDNGANPDAKDSRGHTPLQQAVLSGDKSSAELLLAAGATESMLAPSEKEALDKLLARADAPVYARDAYKDCVKP